jgi:hypothetical protein
MNLQRELEEMREMYEKAEKGRLTSQRELEDLVSTSSDVGKNVRNVIPHKSCNVLYPI